MYNQDSARKYGWTPQWFSVEGFGDALKTAVKKFQREHDLEEDGLVGPSTYRRIFLFRENIISKWESMQIPSGEKSIVYDGNHYSIDWDRVVLWDKPNGFKSTHMKKKFGIPREPKLFVNHWDVCLNSKSCFKVLQNRGLSVHFLIDNDGTIYQTMDIQHIAFHAGNHNDVSIGVEISNAYYPKYQGWYEKNGFGKRPIWKSAVHGKPSKKHMGFYDVQIQAAKALWKAVAKACDIPQRCPIEKGEMLLGIHQQSIEKKWTGFLHHFHISKNKIDCSGFDLVQYLGD